MQVCGGMGIFISCVFWVWFGGMFICNGLNFSFVLGFGLFCVILNEWRDCLNFNLLLGDVDLFVEDFKYLQFWCFSLVVD